MLVRGLLSGAQISKINNRTFLSVIEIRFRTIIVNTKCLFRLFVIFFVSVNLNRGKFHSHLRDVFAPLVIRYIDLMESSIAQSLHKGFQKENWSPVR